MMLRSSSALTCEERQEEVKQMEVYRNHTKFMKSKVAAALGCAPLCDDEACFCSDCSNYLVNSALC